MWHAVGSSPLNRFSMSVVRFRQLRAGQGTEGSRDCRASIASAYAETALQTVFGNAPALLRLQTACRSVNSTTPRCTLGSKLFTRKHNRHYAPSIAQLPTHQPRCTHPQRYSRHCHINLHSQNRLTSSASALLTPPIEH